MESNVLLCCITPSDETQLITNDIIKEIFSTFGTILESFVFSRKVLVKAFVEFADQQSMSHALKKMQSVQLAIGKIKVYKSHKDRIKRKATNEEEAIDISSDSITSMGDFDKDSQKKKSKDANFNSRTSENFYSYSKILNSLSNINEPVESMNDRLQRTKSTSNPNMVNLNVPTLVSGQTNFSSYEAFNMQKRHNTEEESGNAELKVLMVNRIEVKRVTCKFLLNLFGSFGNVTKVLVNKEGAYALIEFETHEQAISAMNHLKSLTFFENTLKIKLSKYTSLCFKTLEKEENPNISYMVGLSNFHRYKTGLSIKVNPPSSLLHFTSVSENVNAVILFELVRQVHEPEKIIQLARKGLNSRMFLVEFKQIFHAIEVLSVLHNKMVDSKKLKVSFSHTKLF
jgi:RNA recognition motif-containing protein